jgi:hypothetical protein
MVKTPNTKGKNTQQMVKTPNTKGKNTQQKVKTPRCCYFKLTTCFGPCSGLSSGHKSIYKKKKYSISHKIYQSKIHISRS